MTRPSKKKTIGIDPTLWDFAQQMAEAWQKAFADWASDREETLKADHP